MFVNNKLSLFCLIHDVVVDVVVVNVDMAPVNLIVDVFVDALNAVVVVVAVVVVDVDLSVLLDKL